MKKLYLILPVALILCFMVGCQQQGEQAAERTTSDELVPLDLKDAHSSWFKALLARDTKGLNRLLSDDVTLGFGDYPMPRARLLSLLQSGDLVYDIIEHENVGFHMHGDTAVVTGRSKEVYRFKGDEDFAHFAYTAVYVRADGEWEMGAYQAAYIDKIAEVEEQNKEIAHNFVNALDEGNFDIHEELLTEDYVSHFAGSPETLDRDTQKQNLQVYYEIFPDNTHTILDIIAEGDKVAFRQVNRTTHSKEFEGLPPTGRQIEYEGMWIFRFDDGKIAESWGVEDFLSFFMQIGMELKPKEVEK